MIRNNLYIHKNIYGKDYLLPSGQLIADLKKPVRINETGAFLWKILEKNMNFDELLQECAKEYGWSEKEKEENSQKVSGFVKTLTDKGILACDDTDASSQRGIEKQTIDDLFTDTFLSGKTVGPYVTTDVYIAGIKMSINLSEELLPGNYLSFWTPRVAVKDTMEITFCEGETSLNSQGTKIINTDEIDIFEYSNGLRLDYKFNKYIKTVYRTRDGRKNIVFSKGFNEAVENDRITLKDEIQAVTRMIFLYIGQRNGLISLHSSSVLYKDRLVLFSAASGVGKSTHATLWEKILKVRQMNGDFNLLSVEKDENGEDVLMVHGTPWCGTSFTFTTASYKPGYIVMLKQGPENKVNEMEMDERLTALLSRTFSPGWNKEMFEYNFELAKEITEKCPIVRYECLPDETAVYVIKEVIDKVI